MNRSGATKKIHEFLDVMSVAILLAMAGTCIWLISTQDRRIWVDLIFDDAYYYLGVARNIVEGNGSSFLPPFQTNGYQPLWLILLVVSGFIFGTSEAGFALQILCMSYAFCMLFFVAARRTLGFGWPAMLATMSFPGTMLFGLETVMLPVLLLLFFQARDWRKRGLIAAAMFLSRLDALSIVVGRDLYRAIVKKDVDIRHWFIVVPVAGIYVLVNQIMFGVPLPVSGLAKMVGNIVGQNLLPVLVYARISLSLLACAAVVYLLSRLPGKRRALKHEEEIVSAVVALFICAAYYSLFSGWPIWPWYYWPLMFLSFVMMYELADALLRAEDFPKPWLALVLMVPLTYPVFVSKAVVGARNMKDILSPLAELRSGAIVGQSYGRDNIDLIAYLRARGIAPGTFFAMGDRAGSFGYFSQGRYQFFHTEGLVGPKQYVDALRVDQGYSFVAKLPVDYVIADREVYFEDPHTIGIAEPIQGMSSTVGPYLLCFRKSGVISDVVRSNGIRRRLLIEFKSLTGCPSTMQQRFLQLRSIYGGLRYFSLPNECKSLPFVGADHSTRSTRQTGRVPCLNAIDALRHE